MHRTFAAVVALALVSVPAFAQPAPPEHDEDMLEPAQAEPGPDHGDRLLRLLEKRLKLKGEQQKKIESVLKDGQPELDRLRGEMQELRERMKKFMRKQHEQVRALLDDEQKEGFDEISVRMRKRLEPGPRRGGGRRYGPWKRPGPPSENEEPGEMGPRDMPPPELWHESGRKSP
ncbi:MAG: hypothetical protein HY553_13200 [Elusimicrobia bacterium]|nr:hypothetical protein [Elusimicrobiota bacterium]